MNELLHERTAWSESDKMKVKAKAVKSTNEFEVKFPKKEQSKEGRLEGLINFIECKINQLKCIRYNDVKLCAKTVRRKLGFGKSPKNKGYGKLITDEEKR